MPSWGIQASCIMETSGGVPPAIAISSFSSAEAPSPGPWKAHFTLTLGASRGDAVAQHLQLLLLVRPGHPRPGGQLDRGRRAVAGAAGRPLPALPAPARRRRRARPPGPGPPPPGRPLSAGATPGAPGTLLQRCRFGLGHATFLLAGESLLAVARR